MVLQKKKQTQVLTTLFIIAVIVWIFVFRDAQQSNVLEVDFFDVGQGDSIFIETPNKRQVLVDGGPDSTILDKLGKEIPFYDRYIDLIILTHPELDHMNGLTEVIKRYNIGAIITNGVVRDTNQYREWIKTIGERNIPIYIARSGGVIELGNDVKLNILYPFESLAGTFFSSTNNTSVVSQLVYKDFEVLLTGDIEKEVERKLVNSGINLKSDILKVPHHGSKTSSTEEFLKAVGSVLNIIQAGKDNKYGHPHREVLERMANVLTFVTGENGDRKILTNGKKFSVNK